MHVVLVNDRSIPVSTYGGTERVVSWLAEELTKINCKVTIIAPNVGAELRAICTAVIAENKAEAIRLIPQSADIVHFHGWLPNNINEHKNWIYTLHGNSTQPELLPIRTICLSRNHAVRHRKSIFVYNGVKLSEFETGKHLYKTNRYLFFSKVKSPGKGIVDALRLTRKYGLTLAVAGGCRADIPSIGAWLNSWRTDVAFLGLIGGKEKVEAFATARALMFPISWEEPFGLVMVESLLSGTPIIATNRGSVGEIVTPEVGYIFDSDSEFELAVESLDHIKPETCRQYAALNFSSKTMAKNYYRLYQQIIESEEIAW